MPSTQEQSFSEIEPADSPQPLTEQQQSFYEEVHAFVRREGRFPRYREIMDEMGYTSFNSVTQLLKALYSKGYLEREGRGQWRLQVGVCPHCGRGATTVITTLADEVARWSGGPIEVRYFPAEKKWVACADFAGTMRPVPQSAGETPEEALRKAAGWTQSSSYSDATR